MIEAHFVLIVLPLLIIVASVVVYRISGRKSD